MRSLIGKSILGLAMVAALAVTLPAVAAEKLHRLAIHVDSGDPKVQNLALNNAENVADHYKKKGEKIQIELVAYGPGLNMLRADKSKVKQRISAMSMEVDNISFSACGVTKGKMEKAEKKKIPIISEAKMVDSGVVRLIELQEAGWSYVRP